MHKISKDIKKWTLDKSKYSKSDLEVSTVFLMERILRETGAPSTFYHSESCL